MFSRRRQLSSRPATVLIMVVGVLAMLFIIGSSLLMMARFERQTVDTKADTRTLKTLGVAIVEPILTQLREDAVGTDGIPYNRGWAKNKVYTTGTGDPSTLESDVDFTGYADFLGNPTITPAQRAVRSGDLLMSSSEPFTDGTWQLYWASWMLDTIPAGMTPPSSPLAVTMLSGPAQPPSPLRDADGDGLSDALHSTLATQISGMFGGSFDMGLRTLPHGGMVLLDKFTHPSLLAQVIHPEDQNTASQSYLANRGALLDLWTTNSNPLVTDPATDETRLRRRYLLSGSEDPQASSDPDWTAIPASDMRKRLPITLGLTPPSGPGSDAVGRLEAPHWWQVDKRTDVRDATWWTDRLNPGIALYTNGYFSKDDLYDRRHLITTVDSDDILRPQRDEIRLGFIDPGPDKIPGTGDDIPKGPVDALSVPVFARAITPSTGPNTTPYANCDYGRLPLLIDPNGNLLFNLVGPNNAPDLRTQFSLRDVLEADVPATYLPAVLPAGSYGRVVKLTAYYLAMIQHTSVPGSGNNLPAVTAPQWEEQLREAAQLAVNTIDFADADMVPTRFQWTGTVSGGAVNIDVTGVEKQPYITEAYAKIVYAPTIPAETPPTWDTSKDSPESIYAVELYNPYDVPLHLDEPAGNEYEIRVVTATGAVTTTALFKNGLVPPAKATIPPYSYLVLCNQDRDPLPADHPLVAAPGTGPVVKIDPTWFPPGSSLRIAQGQSVQLVRVGLPALAAPVGMPLTTATPVDVIVDELAPSNLPNDSNDWWARPPAKNLGAANGDLYSDDFNVGTLPNFCQASPAYTPLFAGRVVVRRPGEDADRKPIGGGVNSTNDRLVRDSSLQRHKEVPGQPPVFWHFTLSRQVTFPLWPEEVHELAPSGNCSLVKLDDLKTRANQHSLMNAGSDAQKAVDSEFRGLPYSMKTVNAAGADVPLFVAKGGIAPFPVLTAKSLPESPNPIPAGLDQSWGVSVEGAGLEITFGSFDVSGAALTIEDSNGNAITSYTGSPNPLLLPNYSSVTLHLKSSGGGGTGFRVTQVKALLGSHAPLAFPTTSSLMLVTRVGHGQQLIPKGPVLQTQQVPVTVAATYPAIKDVSSLSIASVADRNARYFNRTKTPSSPFVNLSLDEIRFEQMRQVDNGHLPVFDKIQSCTDASDTMGAYGGMPQGRLDVPWGNLIHEYFTALPIEELFTPMPVNAGGFLAASPFSKVVGSSVRMVDLAGVAVTKGTPLSLGATPFAMNGYEAVYWNCFQNYPMNVPVSTTAGVTVGPKVKGRININFAPWWVLDGLPALAVTPADLPAAEVEFGYLDVPDPDPLVTAKKYEKNPGVRMMTMTMDENDTTQQLLENVWDYKKTTKPPLDLPTVNMTLGKTIVAARERRSLSGAVQGVNFVNWPANPGLLTRGGILSSIAELNVPVKTSDGNATVDRSLPMSVYEATRYNATSLELGNHLRDYIYQDSGNVYHKPFAYLGYLQLVAPMVRVTDWATTRNHAFTVYATVGTTTDPKVWMRTQVTVDRTRCLYTNDMPERVTETEPIGYYNSKDDQK
jgi:hypothetical protein